MEKSRRVFFKQGLAGALLLGASPLVNAAPDPAKPKTAPAVNPFHLGMAGYTFVNFDLVSICRSTVRMSRSGRFMRSAPLMA